MKENKKETTGWVQITPSPFSIKATHKAKRIQVYRNLMQKSMKSKRPRLSLKAMRLMGLWDQYRATTRSYKDASAGTGDIDVLFLKWLLYA